jgi:hypothetical protein
MRMRDTDRTRLAEPYAGDRAAPGPGPAEALGIHVPNWLRLRDEILGDLSPQSPYGVSWWAPHPGTSRRILISDQLFACAHSAADNLIEAGLHWLEFIDYSERESNRLAHAVTIRGGEPRVSLPRRNSPLDDAELHFARLHMLGVVRSLAGALDCVAGTIIGVTGLPLGILKADFGQLRSYQKARVLPLPRPVAGPLEQFHTSFAETLERIIAAVGTAGWLDWTLAFRHMLVHRGRRAEMAEFIPREPMLYGPGDKPIIRVRLVTHLPEDPARSQIEVFRDPGITPVLGEDAEQTISGLIRSTTRLVDQVGAELLTLWRWRRAHPGIVTQPAVQWRDGASTVRLEFAGYAPGSHPYNPTMLVGNPVLGHRLLAAALDDAHRAEWQAFD